MHGTEHVLTWYVAGMHGGIASARQSALAQGGGESANVVMHELGCPSFSAAVTAADAAFRMDAILLTLPL
eukprot:354442-Chlamydomonas_euryale.AAC.3